MPHCFLSLCLFIFDLSISITMSHYFSISKTTCLIIALSYWLYASQLTYLYKWITVSLFSISIMIYVTIAFSLSLYVSTILCLLLCVSMTLYLSPSTHVYTYLHTHVKIWKEFCQIMLQNVCSRPHYRTFKCTFCFSVQKS